MIYSSIVIIIFINDVINRFMEAMIFIIIGTISDRLSDRAGARRFVLKIVQVLPIQRLIHPILRTLHISDITASVRYPSTFTSKHAAEKRSDGRRGEDASSAAPPCGNCGSRGSEEEGICCEGPCRGWFHIVSLSS